MYVDLVCLGKWNLCGSVLCAVPENYVDVGFEYYVHILVIIMSCHIKF